MYKDQVQALTFDLFGTVLDLGGSLIPFIDPFLKGRHAEIDSEAFWGQWRLRQRVEQYQDNIMALGHSGYREVARRALVYVLELNGVEASADDAEAARDVVVEEMISAGAEFIHRVPVEVDAHLGDTWSK